MAAARWEMRPDWEPRVRRTTQRLEERTTRRRGLVRAMKAMERAARKEMEKEAMVRKARRMAKMTDG